MVAATFAAAAEERSRFSGQELAEFHGGRASAAKARELCAWKKFKVLKPVKEGTLFKAVVGARWVLTW